MRFFNHIEQAAQRYVHRWLKLINIGQCTWQSSGQEFYSVEPIPVGSRIHNYISQDRSYLGCDRAPRSPETVRATRLASSRREDNVSRFLQAGQNLLLPTAKVVHHWHATSERYVLESGITFKGLEGVLNTTYAKRYYRYHAIHDGAVPVEEGTPHSCFKGSNNLKLKGCLRNISCVFCAYC